ncbi:hypothetical protein [Rhodococcus sp. 11-3]|uniref:hypothetical protein n=1 Tax=Rhodococcus sp. 11-3 TaxID=2854796 RepID=UPI00203E8691|nr:hypothetical protein [Rhodococcus sp. 11-3]USC16986.1 hypothetical protein KZJ41_09025 [Rhodococcus sp. 11-3]
MSRSPSGESNCDFYVVAPHIEWDSEVDVTRLIMPCHLDAGHHPAPHLLANHRGEPILFTSTPEEGE